MEAKNTCRKQYTENKTSRHRRTHTLHTLSFLSQRNLSFCALLCINTPSRWPESTALISMAFEPHPMMFASPISAVKQGAHQLEVHNINTECVVLRSLSNPKTHSAPHNVKQSKLGTKVTCTIRHLKSGSLTFRFFLQHKINSKQIKLSQ